MSRKNAAVRREEILAATIEEIEATGLRTLRVSDVAERLGLSASLVIYHFVTKEALVAAAFAHAGQNDLYRARRLAAGRKPSLQRLREVIGWYSPAGSTRSWKIWVDGWSAGLFDEDLRSTFAALDREWKSILSGLIVEGVEAGEFSIAERESGERSSTAESSELTGQSWGCATRILAYLDGLAVQLLFNPDSVTPARLRGWADDFLGHELS